MATHTGPIEVGSSGSAKPKWISDSPQLNDAYSLAEAAHGSRQRPDGRTFLAHVVEVAGLLHGAGFEDEIVAVGLLHDAVERGELSREELRDEMGVGITSLLLTRSEDSTIAATVHAADKLSDIRGLRRAIEIHGDALPERLGTSVASMTAQYGESVRMIEVMRPRSVFLPALRVELEGLEAQISNA